MSGRSSEGREREREREGGRGEEIGCSGGVESVWVFHDLLLVICHSLEVWT